MSNLKNLLIKDSIDDDNRFIFKTGLSFLAQHCGYRNGKMHMLLGVTGGGKSTMTRSMIYDFCKNNKKKKALIFLSEEDKVSLEKELYKIESDISWANNLIIVSGLDGSDFFTSVKKNRFDIIFHDNITTSNEYNDKKPQEQSKYINKVKQLISELNVPFVVVAHTGATSAMNQNKIIDVNDIRGSKTIINISEYIYIMTTFLIGNNMNQFITTNKNRTHMTTEKISMLDFDKVKRIYTKSTRVTFDEYNQIFKTRDILGKK